MVKTELTALSYFIVKAKISTLKKKKADITAVLAHSTQAKAISKNFHHKLHLTSTFKTKQTFQARLVMNS